MTPAPAPAAPRPVVVTLAFAGSRQLLDDPTGRIDLRAFESALQDQLARSLGELPARLRLSTHDVLCGQSQIAVGADTLFTRACAARGMAQRIVLPEPRDAFLHAHDADGTPDFSADERTEALHWLRSAHIVDERVASRSLSREARFLDTNIELVRSSDVVICLIRAGAVGRPGGAQHFLDTARRHAKPAWEMRVACVDGRPECHSSFHHWPDRDHPG